MSRPTPAYHYKTRYDVPPEEVNRNSYSILRTGDDVNAQLFDSLGPDFRLVQINVHGHARQAKIAIGSCAMLADLVKIPPQYRSWQPDVQLFVNARTSEPKTFLGGDSFLNAKDAHIRVLPGRYFLGFDTSPRKPTQDPFGKTTITQITGPDRDGKIMTWDTITTSRVVDDPDLSEILINTARTIGIDNRDVQDMFAQVVLEELESSPHHPPGLGPIAMTQFKKPT